MYSPGIAHPEEFADDFYAQRAAAIQAEFITAEARGAPQLDGVQPQALPHNDEPVVGRWSVQLLAISRSRLRRCQPSRMFHCEKERKEQAHPADQLASLALPRELPMRSRSPLFGWLHLFQMEVRH